jgi:Kef-type K+ transport system membrane component KefB
MCVIEPHLLQISLVVIVYVCVWFFFTIPSRNADKVVCVLLYAPTLHFVFIVANIGISYDCDHKIKIICS